MGFVTVPLRMAPSSFPGTLMYGCGRRAVVGPSLCRQDCWYRTSDLSLPIHSEKKYGSAIASAVGTGVPGVGSKLCLTSPVISAPPSASQPEFIVRSARVEELDDVANLRCGSFYASLPEERYASLQREIKQVVLGRWRNPNAHCLVAIDPESLELIGTCDATMYDSTKRKSFRLFQQGDGIKQETKQMYVSSMAVRPDARRRGVAKNLLARVVEAGDQTGCKEVLLHVEWDNKPAVSLYQGCGFEKYGPMVPQWLKSLSQPEHTLMVKRLA